MIVDVETTGWQPEEASITEIGAVRVSAGQPRAEFSALINPGGPIPADITALTGITDAMVRQAPPVGAVLPGFLAFARGCVLTAHNAPFDVGFLSAACGRYRIPWPDFPVLDTATLARSVLGRDRGARLQAGHAGRLLRRQDQAVPPRAGRRQGHRGRAAGPARQAGVGGVRTSRRSAPDRAQTPGVRYWRPAPPARRGRDEPAAEEAAVVTAIVLVKADVARIPETAEAIAQIPEVSEVYSVTGEFDLVAMVRVRAHEELGDVIPGTLNRVPGVTHTETHIAFRTYSRHDLEAAFALGFSEPA